MSRVVKIFNLISGDRVIGLCEPDDLNSEDPFIDVLYPYLILQRENEEDTVSLTLEMLQPESSDRNVLINKHNLLFFPSNAGEEIEEFYFEFAQKYIIRDQQQADEERKQKSFYLLDALDFTENDIT